MSQNTFEVSIEFLSCPQVSRERLGDACRLEDLKKVCNVCWLGRMRGREVVGF
jgi:hypothetical protein